MDVLILQWCVFFYLPASPFACVVKIDSQFWGWFMVAEEDLIGTRGKRSKVKKFPVLIKMIKV